MTIHGTSGSTTSSTIGSSTIVGAELIRSTLAGLGNQTEQAADPGGVDGPADPERGRHEYTVVLGVPPPRLHPVDRRHAEVVRDETADAYLPRALRGRQPQLFDDRRDGHGECCELDEAPQAVHRLILSRGPRYRLGRERPSARVRPEGDLRRRIVGLRGRLARLLAVHV